MGLGLGGWRFRGFGGSPKGRGLATSETSIWMHLAVSSRVRGKWSRIHRNGPSLKKILHDWPGPFEALWPAASPAQAGMGLWYLARGKGMLSSIHDMHVYTYMFIPAYPSIFCLCFCNCNSSFCMHSLCIMYPTPMSVPISTFPASRTPPSYPTSALCHIKRPRQAEAYILSCLLNPRPIP